jgi:fukutin
VICEENFILQLTVFYKRGHYFWTGSDDVHLNIDSKHFNDVARGLNKFETQLYERDVSFYIPVDIKAFSFDYSRSKFLECNSHLRELSWTRIKQNRVKNLAVSTVFQNISKSLDSLQISYWFADGTLLGWYRDCGIIPFTNDADFGIFANDYSPAIKQLFFLNDLASLSETLGVAKDNFELRIRSKDFLFEIFLYYPFNFTHLSYAFQKGNRQKLKFVFG